MAQGHLFLFKKFFGMRGLGSVQMKPFTVAYLLRDYFRGMSGEAACRSLLPFAFEFTTYWSDMHDANERRLQQYVGTNI